MNERLHQAAFNEVSSFSCELSSYIISFCTAWIMRMNINVAQNNLLVIPECIVIIFGESTGSLRFPFKATTWGKKLGLKLRP